MKSNVHIHGALRVEYRVQTLAQSHTTARITSEQRLAGGQGAVLALALAALGVQVRLSGNPIGIDSHGRFLLSQLQNVPHLELDIEVRDEVVTPYAILIRGESGDVQTLLSSEAASLDGNGDYNALLEALRAALAEFLEAAQVEAFILSYDASFGDFAAGDFAAGDFAVWKHIAS